MPLAQERHKFGVNIQSLNAKDFPEKGPKGNLELILNILKHQCYPTFYGMGY